MKMSWMAASILAVVSAAFGQTLTVTDALQRTVEFAQPPQRIVVTGKASFMLANALCLFPEARERTLLLPSGTVSREGSGDFLSLVRPGQTPDSLPATAGAEQIAATHPDVVLLKTSAAQLGDVLDRLGLRVVYLDFETPAHYERDLAILGQLLGAEDRARFLVSYYRDVAAGVRDRTAALSGAAKPRVLLLQYSERSGAAAFSVPSPDWIQTALVETAGGTPVWKESAQRGGWTVVNLEQVAAWDPDVVFVVNYATSANQAVARILADGRWQALRAARDGKVFAFPGDFCSWDQPDTRWSLGLLWMATRLHPALFGETDLAQEVIRFHALYGLDAITVQSRVIPLIREDIGHGRN